MNLLFDQNISFRVVKRISEHFIGSVHVSDLGLVNATDIEIWNYARMNNYAIVTFDSDFTDLSILKGHPPKIIWIRSTIQTSPQIIDLITLHKEGIKEFLHNDAFSELACLEITN